MKATQMYWGTAAPTYNGPRSFSVYLLHCNKKFQVRIETGGKPIWSEYFDRLSEATEWGYQNAKEKPVMVKTRDDFAAGVHLEHVKEGTVSVEELIKKYNVQPEDAKELRDFSEFLRVRKKDKLDRLVSQYRAQTWSVAERNGVGTVWCMPGGKYFWTVPSLEQGKLYAATQYVGDQKTAEASLRSFMEAAGL